MQTMLIISSVALWILLGLNIWATIILIGMMKEMNKRFDALQYKGLNIGETAPSFTAMTLDGTIATQDSYANQVTAFVFSMPECEHCQKVIPTLNKIWKPAKQAGVELVSVISGEESAARKFAEQYQIQTPVLITSFGQDSFVANYKISAFPSYCILDAQHRVQAIGIVGDDTWELTVKQWDIHKFITT